jgi:hypothetical protein
MATTDWSRDEVEAVVADYLHMLTQELAGQVYNKTTHRRALAMKLNDRSDGSIERKHQNISAVLIELGCPYISGYKPLGNYQGLLFDVVAEQVGRDSAFDRAALGAAQQQFVPPLTQNFAAMLEDPPKLELSDSARSEYRAPRRAMHRDYIAREAANRSLGEAGEILVVEYERDRLFRSGHRRLSDRVEHVSRVKGDGLGYDVLSYEPSGRERYIEVKTTTFGKQTPFYISRNEVDFSDEAREQFQLYRLFDFRKQPRLFALEGPVRTRCALDPLTYIARFT